jgi:hypothetical protein
MASTSALSKKEFFSRVFVCGGRKIRVKPQKHLRWQVIQKNLKFYKKLKISFFRF